MTDDRPAPAEPWRIYDMLLLYGFSAVGYAVLLVAWWGLSGTAKVNDQIVWVNIAVVAVMILGTGNGMWLLTGRRAIGERRQRLLAEFELTDELPIIDATVEEPTVGRPVAADGMAHYHRPDCQLVRGKTAPAKTVSAHERSGRRPCGMCRP